MRAAAPEKGSGGGGGRRDHGGVRGGVVLHPLRRGGDSGSGRLQGPVGAVPEGSEEAPAQAGEEWGFSGLG